MEIVGKLLANRYEIIEKIGEGGMAYVYKARCRLLNRYVAVKILKEEYSKDETFVRRFRAEAQSAASLTHANIVSVYDVGTENDINYIVMELLENKTLKDYIEEHGALSSDLTLKIAAQIASALETAHRAHIIHRDIKPHNIILNKNLVAKVTDFGIAKITNTTSATITSFGATMGSVHYFSPEHAKGGYTDEKSDIYSLGVVMYEMATGKLPFDGETPVSVALKHIQEEPLAPSIVNPSVSPALNQIILKAMKKSTTERYQNATELLTDISIALSKPNGMIVKNTSSVEAGATQVIPTISPDMYTSNDNAIPNIRTRKTSTSSGSRSSYARDMKYSQENLNKDDIEDSEFKKKNKKKNLIIVGILVAILIIVCTFFGIKMVNKMNKDKEANREVEIPNVVGKSFDEIVKEYKEKGIEVLQDNEEYDEKQEAGHIISQRPEAGTVTKDKKIYVVVSKGTKLVEVSDVTNKDFKVAKYELEDTKGFKVERVDVVNEKIAAGIVISQEYKNEMRPAGSTIKLNVSVGDGKKSVIMPSVLGATEAEAKKSLEDRKLTVSVKTGEDKSKANGVVIAQSYPENQELKEGDLVEITINKLLKTKTIILKMSDLLGGKQEKDAKVRVEASVDGGPTNNVFNEQTIPVTQSTISFDINGYNNAKITIYVDGSAVSTRTENFN